MDQTSDLPPEVALPSAAAKTVLFFPTLLPTQCGVALATANPFLCAQELESTAALCFKAAEGSTDVVRCSVAGLLGQLLIGSQQALPPHQKGKVWTGHWHRHTRL